MRVCRNPAEAIHATSAPTSFESHPQYRPHDSFAHTAPVISSSDRSGNATPTVRYNNESIVFKGGRAESTGSRFRENSETRNSATPRPINPPNSTGFEFILSFSFDTFC